MRRLKLTKNLCEQIRLGHPWVFDRALDAASGNFAAGECANLVYQNESVATAYIDPRSPIRARILHPGAIKINSAWIRNAAQKAAHLRMAMPRLSDALRIIHGENDYMPGITMDLYGDVAVVVFDGEGARAFWDLEAIIDGVVQAGFPIRSVRKKRGETLWGDPAPDTVLIEEHGARFEVDLLKGQKTGFFLDQRDNRKRVADLAAGQRVLNLFSYTGGFSVLAALGGASYVASVDLAKPAIDNAKRNFQLNDLPIDNHGFFAEDAFDFLNRAIQDLNRFDIVIVDPPSFAPRQKARANALRAYQKLNALALQVVEPGGIFVSASCSSHITPKDINDFVGKASLDAKRRIRILSTHGAAPDHPTRPYFPEGEYLTLLMAHVE